MKRDTDGGILYSPTDLCRFVESPFVTWMDRFALERPSEVEPDADSEEMLLLAREGTGFERRYLEKLQAEGKDVADLTGEGIAATRAAMRDGRGRACGFRNNTSCNHASSSRPSPRAESGSRSSGTGAWPVRRIRGVA